MKNKKYIRDRTIEDFKQQWIIHGKLKDDYWTSNKWIENICKNIFDLTDIKGKRILEVGSGSGRITKMLLKYSPKHIIAVEPSNNTALYENTKDIENIEIDISNGSNFNHKNIDYIFSIGVIHHILDPIDVLKYPSIVEL